ncbi:serine--tRNA ligase [Candidatus Phytoplasma phoenicium]|uniref:Serine--tRNA ligase n=1 Tax=Candidatus Phytoplasma phoenicium TaxID=198422 RepID=A0A0L0MIF1_9MOLU|nr:serine--tRNA ligase [Candidatus Phytoplasma phoenicium]KND62487.1 Seryl-tRNA synthetase [Candidatus Phytoplasma phoenicium]
MLELKFVLQNMNLVIDKLQKRQGDFTYLQELLKLNQLRKNFLSQIENLRQHKNTFSQSIEESQQQNIINKDLIEKEKNSKKNLKQLESQLFIVEKKIQQILMNTPNVPHDSTPYGIKPEDNLEIYRSPKNINISFFPKDHITLNNKLGILDFDRAAKITGSKFVVLKGAGALLERSLINFMLDSHVNNGYKEILAPFIVNEMSMLSTGQLPKFEEELFKLKLTKQNWYLNPTAEVPLINLHRQEVLNVNQLPIKYVGYTTCFRQEAGAAGKENRGISRQKQFNKIELIQFTEPKQSYLILDKMLKDSEDILKKLELPYRIVILSSGDLGFSATKTYDIEVWLPGQQKYLEIASISNTETFQALRANIKFIKDHKTKKKYVHTLNGSALAIGRTLLAILENYQNQDGSITIPKVLRPYTKIDIIK